MTPRLGEGYGAMYYERVRAERAAEHQKRVDEFLGQVRVVALWIVVVLVLAFAGSLFWNPLVAACGLGLLSVIPKVTRISVKAAWGEAMPYSGCTPEVGDYWMGTFMIGFVLLFAGAAAVLGLWIVSVA